MGSGRHSACAVDCVCPGVFRGEGAAMATPLEATKAQRRRRSKTPKTSVAKRPEKLVEGALEAAGKGAHMNEAKKAASKEGDIKLKPGTRYLKHEAPLHSRYLYINKGYRAGMNMKETLFSLFQLHNETMNIWIHFAGAIFMLCLLLSLTNTLPSVHVNTSKVYSSLADVSLTFDVAFQKKFDSLFDTVEGFSAQDNLVHAASQLKETKDALIVTARNSGAIARQKMEQLKIQFQQSSHFMYDFAEEKRDASWQNLVALNQQLLTLVQERVQHHTGIGLPRWPVVLFMLTAIYCMTMSAAYHLFSSLSEKTMKKFRSLDFAGISLLTFGSAMPFLYYAFCSPFWRMFHMIFFSSFSLLTFSFAFVDYNVYLKVSEERYGVLRTYGFVASGLCALVPVGHCVYNYVALSVPMPWSEITMFVAEGCVYAIGTVFYITSFPESMFSKQGTFDYFCNSHQLWHVAVFLACWIHYNATLSLYSWRQENVCPHVSETLLHD